MHAHKVPFPIIVLYFEPLKSIYLSWRMTCVLYTVYTECTYIYVFSMKNNSTRTYV